MVNNNYIFGPEIMFVAIHGTYMGRNIHGDRLDGT
jgi:hypothetical protein